MTGGGSGIGRCTAHELAALGAHVALVGRTLDKLKTVKAEIAEDGLAQAAKDISMAGLVGTALMLLECSGVGAAIQLDRIPRPEGIALARWLTAFPSYGYILSVAPDRVAAVIDRFASRGIAAAAIGSVDASRVARIAEAGAEAVVWDFAVSPLIGCGGVAR